MTLPPQTADAPLPDNYARFLARLKGYERLEPYPKSRGEEKLAGVRSLVAALGHPETAYRIVHVAGTNGKGLTAAMIDALLRRAGLRTGLYTSPHVLDIRERITLDGAPIAPAAFARAGHAVLDLADARRAATHFSYFDLLTAIALLAFRQAGAEWAVLETGLGGLSDATNITPKELAVLTRIGLDHLHVLGDSLPAIATQKLGIVRPGVPTVVAAQAPELTPWLAEQVHARGSTPHPADAFRLEAPDGAGPVRVTWADGTTLEAAPPEGTAVTLPRLACAANALAAAELLLGPAGGEERAGRVRAALGVSLPGRLELRRNVRLRGHGGPPLATVVLDGGHNPEAMQALADQLARWGLPECTLLLALQADKLVPPLYEPLRALLARSARVLLLQPQTVRAPGLEQLQAYLAPLLPAGVTPEPCETPRAALERAASMPTQPLVAAGSFWTLGDLMAELEDGSE